MSKSLRKQVIYCNNVEKAKKDCVQIAFYFQPPFVCCYNHLLMPKMCIILIMELLSVLYFDKITQFISAGFTSLLQLNLNQCGLSDKGCEKLSGESVLYNLYNDSGKKCYSFQCSLANLTISQLQFPSLCLCLHAQSETSVGIQDRLKNCQQDMTSPQSFVQSIDILSISHYNCHSHVIIY